MCVCMCRRRLPAPRTHDANARDAVGDVRCRIEGAEWVLHSYAGTMRKLVPADCRPARAPCACWPRQASQAAQLAAAASQEWRPHPCQCCSFPLPTCRFPRSLNDTPNTMTTAQPHSSRGAMKRVMTLLFGSSFLPLSCVTGTRGVGEGGGRPAARCPHVPRRQLPTNVPQRVPRWDARQGSASTHPPSLKSPGRRAPGGSPSSALSALLPCFPCAP